MGQYPMPPSVGASGLVLDIGSASGTQSFGFARHADGVVALDLSRHELEKLVARRDRPASVLPLQGDAAHLPFRSGVFDSAALLEVLEHVDTPAQVLAECWRVLKPGGALEVSVPTAYTEKLYWRLHPAYREQSTHARIFERDEIIGLLEAEGFHLGRIETRHFGPMIAWAFHGVLRTPADHTGVVLRNRWVDTVVAKAVGVARRLPGTRGAVNRLSSRYGKSWWFSCAKSLVL